MDCPLNTTEAELGLPITPVEGSVCFFGKIPGTYAANFDVNGSYWCGEWGRDGMMGGACGCFPNLTELVVFQRCLEFESVDSFGDKKKVQVTKKTS